LVEPRLAARDVRVDCEESQQDRKVVQEGESHPFATLSLSCAFLRTAHWSARRAKGYGRSERTQKTALVPISGRAGIWLFAVFWSERYLVIDIWPIRCSFGQNIDGWCSV